MSLVRPGEDVNSGSEDIFTKASVENENFYAGGFNADQMYQDPLLTGFAFIVWTRLPEWVTKEYQNFRKLTQKNFQGFDGLADLDITPVGITEGFSPNEYAVAQNMNGKPNTFTLRHNEYSGSPIRNAYTHWVTGIRDPNTGIATYPKQYGLDYRAKNHTGELMYMVVRPDANNVDKKIIEFACYWTAVWPQRVNLAHLSFAKSTQTAPIELEQPFSGVFNMSPAVDKAAADLLRSGAHGFDFQEMAGYEPSNVSAG